MDPTIILKQKVTGLSQRGLAGFVTQACRAAGLRGTVTVLITGNSEIRSLNARFRGKDRPTDVLSFPSLGCAEAFAGDIAVSLDTAARNARSLGHSVTEEVKVLVLHGILHLAGYDHESDRGEMADKEQRLRRRLGLPIALMERGSVATQPRKQPARYARVRSPK